MDAMIRSASLLFFQCRFLCGLFAVTCSQITWADQSPLAASGINQVEVQPAESPVQSAPADKVLGAVTPANSAAARVASKLDTDGIIYLYWSAEKILGEFDKKIESVREMAASDSGLSEDEKNSLRKDFDLGIRLIRDSGLQGVKAFGLSSREVEPGIFLNKTFTYVPDRSGFLWNTIAKVPHDFPFVEMMPENTEGFAFFDLDLAVLWQAVSKKLANSAIPEAAKWQEHLRRQVQAFTGLGLEELLDSLDDQLGLLVTLNQKTAIEIPLGNEHYEMPEPAAALVWKVKNEKLFDRLDALLTMNPKVAKIEEPGLRMRVMEGIEELPYLSPSLARYGDYLIISSSEKLVREMKDSVAGKRPGLKSNPDFIKLAAGMAEKGNGAMYLSRHLQKTLSGLQSKFSQLQGNGNSLLEAISAKFANLSADTDTYVVGGTADDGWFTTGKTTKDINEVLGEFLTLPSYYLAIAAVEEMKQNRANDKLTKIKKNLVDLRTAKEEAISEKNLQEGQMLNRQDIEEYITAWPQSVVGETYEVGTVGQAPYATAPIDLGECRAGSKIEP
jgi:hypothetical protein